MGARATRPTAALRATLLASVVLLAAGGRARADDSATDGTRTLSVSQSAGLAAEGQSVTVSGSGYDRSKGIYVALCVATPKGTLPSPCGGGIDRAGTSGASEWISDNPPSYATGLTKPYGEGGTFTVTIHVGPLINAVTDCRVVRCAIVTKSDHTINEDRSQDVLIPVTFLGQPTATTTTLAAKATSSSAAPDGTSATTVDPGTAASSEEPTVTSLAPTTTAAGVTEVTVVDGVDDLADVARSADHQWVPVPGMLAIALLVVGAAIVAWIATRRRS